MWCKKLEKDTYPDKQVIQLTEQFVPVKVNAEKDGAAVAKKYNVHGYPTILFIDPDGNVDNKIVGFSPPSGFSRELGWIARVHTDFDRMKAQIESNPKDPEAAAFLAKAYAMKGDEVHASQMLLQAERDGPPPDGKVSMAEDYNALGDLYQNKNALDKAEALFNKAIATGKDPYDVSYARMSLAFCYLQSSKKAEAIAELKAASGVPGCPADMKAEIDGFVTALSK